jgi:aryl-alcohol dehydrogenase-like predicted oxidoreductase
MIKGNLKKKIIIGTANFTQQYGIKPKKVNTTQLKKIFNFIKKNQIFTIDTASNYFDKNYFLKDLNKKHLIITKFVFNSKWKDINFCRKKIDEFKKKINNAKIKAILFHNTKVLFSKNGPKIFKNLEKLKSEGDFDSIGLSIYDFDELNFLIKKYNIDIVQCPYNLLDQRIIQSGWYKELKMRKIEIHVRSIFLKGLLVDKNFYKQVFFKNWKKIFKSWFEILKKNNISPIDYCLSDLCTYNFDNIIIGINDINDLKEIINFKFINKKIKEFDNIKYSKKILIDPRKWKLNEN